MYDALGEGDGVAIRHVLVIRLKLEDAWLQGFGHRTRAREMLKRGLVVRQAPRSVWPLPTVHHDTVLQFARLRGRITRDGVAPVVVGPSVRYVLCGDPWDGRKLIGSPMRLAVQVCAALADAARRPSDVVMSAMVGAAGLKPTLAAIERGATVALANKMARIAWALMTRKEIYRATGHAAAAPAATA